jgi:hypothetical protein
MDPSSVNFALRVPDARSKKLWFHTGLSIAAQEVHIGPQ